MNSIDDLRIFQKVAELASFTQTSEFLRIPKAKVSQAIARLEEELRTKLFSRTTRVVKLTHDGEVLRERLKDILSDIDEIESLFVDEGKSVSGRLRIDVPQSLGTKFLIPKLPEFLKAHPGIKVELSTTDRQVDLVREGFDCVLRVGNRLDSELIAKRIGYLSIGNFASKAYLKTRGTPKNLNDLDHHQLVTYTSSFGRKADGFEYLVEDEYKMKPMPSAITVNSTESYLAAAIAGLGIIQAPYIGTRAATENGILMEILKNFKAEPMPVSLLFPHRQNLSKRTRVFMNWLEGVLLDYID